jgi:hypothetical protein
MQPQPLFLSCCRLQFLLLPFFRCGDRRQPTGIAKSVYPSTVVGRVLTVAHWAADLASTASPASTSVSTSDGNHRWNQLRTKTSLELATMAIADSFYANRVAFWRCRVLNFSFRDVRAGLFNLKVIMSRTLFPRLFHFCLIILSWFIVLRWDPSPVQQEIDVLKITMRLHAVRMGADRMHPAALTKVSV